MKRRTERRRSAAEKKADSQRHYGALAEGMPSRKAREDFLRPAYPDWERKKSQGQND